MNVRIRRIFAVFIAVLMVTSIPVAYVAIDAPGSDQISGPIGTAEAYDSVVWSGGYSDVEDVEYSSSNDLLYLAAGSSVKAVDPSDGTQVWSTGLNGSALTLGYDEGVDALAVGVHSAANRTAQKLDPNNGSVIWAKNITGDVASVRGIAMGSSGTIYAGISESSASGEVYEVQSDGSVGWIYSGLSDSVYGVEAYGSTIYAGDSSGNIHSISSSGSFVDSYGNWSDRVYELDIDETNGDLYGVTYDGDTIFRYDSAGTETWSVGSYSFGGAEAIAVDGQNGYVYAGGYDGRYVSLNKDDGSENWQFSDHEYNVQSLAVDSSTGYVYSGGHGSIYAVDPGLTFTENVSGTVVNQNGDPVEGATVEGWGYVAPSYSQASTELSDLSDPIPSEFIDQLNSGFQLEGTTGYFADRENDYAVIFNQRDWPSGITIDHPDLSPKWKDIRPGERLVLTSWDPTSPRSGGIDKHLPGQTTDAPIVIEQLDGSGDVVDTDTYKLNDEYTMVDATWPPAKTHVFTKTVLDTGIYRIYAQGNAEAAYYVKVGDPKPTLDDALEAIDGALSKQAQAIDDKLSTGDLIRTKTTTDENGSFSLGIDPSAKSVQLQAYKKPDELTSIDANSLTLDNLRNFSATDYNGSFVLPSDIKRVNPPESGVEISVIESETPTFSGLGEYQNLTNWLDEQLDDLSYEDLGDTLQQRLENTSREELEKLNNDLEQLVNQNENLRDKLNQTSVNESDLTDGELQDRIGELESTIDGLRNTIEEGSEEFSRSNETITWRKQFGTELASEDVLLLVHYTNGTTDTLTTDSEYVNIDSQLGQGDAVVVEDLPLGDAAGAGLEVIVANEDGTGSATRQVNNPTFDGEIPGLSSIAFSSLHPGASETVSMQLNPEDDSTIAEVSSATVYGPDGNTINSSVSERKLTFQTDVAGVYDVRAKFTNQDGDEFTLTQKVKAGETDLDLPPGIRAEETPYGTVAIVGDGLEDGDVEVQDGGATIRLLGQIDEDEDPPRRVDANTETISVLATHETSVSIVRGESQEGITKNVRVVLKEPPLDTDSQGITNFGPILYRNGNPLPEGESSDGKAELGDSSTRIETYTDTTGSVTIRTIENPSATQWVRYQFDTIELPSVADIIPAVIGAP